MVYDHGAVAGFPQRNAEAAQRFAKEGLINEKASPGEGEALWK
jgi:hypothetical protein